jgi:hypothetical protein
MSDHIEIKNRLAEYLSLKGIEYNKRSKTYRCMFHSDENPSATLYQNAGGHVLTCHVCDKSYDIFNICGQLENLSSFPEQLKSVKSALGIYNAEPEPRIGKDTSIHSESRRLSGGHVTLNIDDARKIYTRENIEKISGRTEWGEIKQTWKYLDRSGNVQALDVRFESVNPDGMTKKSVITFWYDGKKLQTKNYPILIYGLDRVYKSDDTCPVLIHEGAKCAEIGEDNINGDFINISWNGGAGKAHLVNWSILKNREVFILRDNDDPGLKAANDIKKQLPHAKIVNPPTSGKGDDIEQFLHIMSPGELTEYILKSSDITAPIPAEMSPDTPTSHPGDSKVAGFSEPFRILGLCEGEAHFIDEWGFYQHYKLEALSKGKLNNLANLNYWRSEYPAGRNGCAWDDAIDYVVCASKIKEFDTKRLRGRGAWRTGDKICYNDGLKVYGEPDPEMIYMKLKRKPIGLETKPADYNLIKRIRELIFDLSFDTKTDAVRTMGWAALAPFCGALEYRPTLLMTGESGHGKTKTQKLFIEKITDFFHADMRTSSEAGVRRMIDKDSKVVFFDEGGKENDKMKLNFDSIMSFIRSNYSDESPDGVKANMNGEGYVTYKLNSMFGLATTDPTIENVQDENRILRVHFVKPKHTADEWQAIETELTELLSKENCDAIRALIWSRLKVITCLTKKLVQLARNKTNRDYRSSYADMLLASAYMVVWCNTLEPTEEQITDMLDKYYAFQPVEANRSEVEEYIGRILDEVIEILHESGREKVTILEALNRINSGHILNDEGQYEEFSGKRRAAHIRTLQQYGIKLHHKGVHFANDNHLIKKITGLGKGYEKLFARHKGYVKHDDPISYSGGGSKRGTIINGLLDKSDVEKLEGVF